MTIDRSLLKRSYPQRPILARAGPGGAFSEEDGFGSGGLLTPDYPFVQTCPLNTVAGSSLAASANRGACSHLLRARRLIRGTIRSVCASDTCQPVHLRCAAYTNRDICNLSANPSLQRTTPGRSPGCGR
jgi:hypothetical protein